MTSHRDFEGERQTVKKKKKLKSPFFLDFVSEKTAVGQKTEKFTNKFWASWNGQRTDYGCVCVCVQKKKKYHLYISVEQWWSRRKTSCIQTNRLSPVLNIFFLFPSLITPLFISMVIRGEDLLHLPHSAPTVLYRHQTNNNKLLFLLSFSQFFLYQSVFISICPHKILNYIFLFAE